MNNKFEKIVLSEEVYTLCLSYIIERDFYPNLNQLNQKLIQIFQELNLFYELENNLVELLKNSEHSIDLSLNLDIFLSIYTSEDNQSYEKIIKKYELKRENLINKLESYNTKHLRIENGEKGDPLLIKDNEVKRIEGWQYKAKNALMFLPDSQAENNVNNLQLVSTRAPPKEIAYSNTRFNVDQSELEDVIPDDKPHAGDYVPPIHASLGPGAIVGVDGRNYDLLNSPVNPLPTKSTPSYMIPETPRRDLLAYQLSKKSKLSSTMKSATPRTRASMGSSTPLSPAGRRLLEQLGKKKKTTGSKTKYGAF